ncbi:hypothetical protein CYMTET_42607 [Cymbomonas tetramitiformis]|uniref:Thioredoxin domain-containing protein n=1 Tax=Cymbomonas tetramitiformis TaxID=36881 RepID=A0AAE0C3U3_9CHLO|nr:hypothetical protein CYMTET_42607 [Cymbomonas tetramitiformis]
MLNGKVITSKCLHSSEALRKRKHNLARKPLCRSLTTFSSIDDLGTDEVLPVVKYTPSILSENVRKADALGFSAERIPNYHVSRLKALNRSFYHNPEGLEESELRKNLEDVYDAFAIGSTPKKVVNQQEPKNKPANLIQIHSTEELQQAMQSLETANVLVACYFWKENCYACHSVVPKLYSVAAKYEQVVFLKISFDDHDSLCRSLQVERLPFIQLYRGSYGLLDSFAIPLTNIQTLRTALDLHSAEQCSLACLLECPYPCLPSWPKFGQPEAIYEDS